MQRFLQLLHPSRHRFLPQARNHSWLWFRCRRRPNRRRILQKTRFQKPIQTYRSKADKQLCRPLLWFSVLQPQLDNHTHRRQGLGKLHRGYPGSQVILWTPILTRLFSSLPIIGQSSSAAKTQSRRGRHTGRRFHHFLPSFCSFPRCHSLRFHHRNHHDRLIHRRTHCRRLLKPC